VLSSLLEPLSLTSEVRDKTSQSAEGHPMLQVVKRKPAVVVLCNLPQSI
jgi:hypothetical protein